MLRRRLVGYVFQSYNLVPDLDGGRERRARRAAGRCLAAARPGAGPPELLDELGRRRRRRRSTPRELSGGQQQRVALARALVNRPRRSCSPTSPPAPSTPSRPAAVLGLLRRQPTTGGQTIVLVTHDHRVAAAADRVLVMQDGAIRRRAHASGLVRAASAVARQPPSRCEAR